MKALTQVLIVLLMFFTVAGFAQEKSKKQVKEEQKLERQKETEVMVNAQSFVFNAKTALPQGYKTVQLNTREYNVNFLPDFIVSYMPFYGRAYSSIGYGNDNGLKFEGKPGEFTVTKGKKNFQVKAVVKGENDVYTLSLSVSFEGSASITITSNNRSPISYSGDISAPEKAEEKK
jgi:hypothetical protein